MAFKRLFSIAHRPGRDRSPADGPAVELPAVAPDDTPLGPPPVLRPAAIFRQLLFDPAESAPVWARPRPAPAPEAASSSGPIADRPAAVRSRTDKAKVAGAASTDAPKPTKRTRRPTASGSTPGGSSPAAPRTRSKRVTKPGSAPEG